LGTDELFTETGPRQCVFFTLKMCVLSLPWWCWEIMWVARHKH